MFNIKKKRWDYFINRRGKISPEEYQGELTLLKSEYFNLLYEDILNGWEPKKDRVIFGICTRTRPYSNSIKWKKWIKEFGYYSDKR